MKIRINRQTIALLLAISTIVYQSITSMTNQGEVQGGINILSVLWLGVVLLSILLFLTSDRRDKLKLDYLLLFYNLYAIIVCLFNGYISKFFAQPTLIFSITFWIFIYYIFYDSSRRGFINYQKLSTFFFILMVVLFVLFFSYYNANSSSEYYAGLNVVYYLLFLLPFILINNNKRIVYTCLVLVFICVLLSCKRGALVTYVVGVTFWFLNNKDEYTRNEKIKKILLYLVILSVSVVLFYIVVNRFNLSIGDRMRSFLTGDDEGGSGRLKIWGSILTQAKQDDVFAIIFGRGFDSTKMNSKYLLYHLTWAHNDYLQVFMDYGVIGLVTLLVIISKLFRYGKLMKTESIHYYASFVSSVLMFVICCFISMVLSNSFWFLSMAAFWGCVIGDFERRRYEQS